MIWRIMYILYLVMGVFGFFYTSETTFHNLCYLSGFLLGAAMLPLNIMASWEKNGINSRATCGIFNSLWLFGDKYNVICWGVDIEDSKSNITKKDEL